MSSVYPTRLLREPLPRWRRPSSEYLLERIYKRGKPPFWKFPSVQDVIDAVLCPVSIVHKFYHGFRGALGRMRRGEENIGELFHELIHYIKTAIISGEHSPNEVGSLFYEFCRRRGITEEVERALRQYLTYWLRRKQRNLEELWRERPRIFFEIHIASVNVTFHGSGTRYPIHGVIDELDISNKRIIERTTRGSYDDENPPFLKDFQVWLLWKILTSIDRSIIPETWREENFEEYELFVETPYRDFRVEKDQQLFDRWALDALAWIGDISRTTTVIPEAWRNRGRHDKPCRFGEEVEECSMAYFACYHGRRQFPQRRAALSAAFRSLYRALFNEQLWSHDLLLYQLVLMEQDPRLRNDLRELLVGRRIFPIEIEESLGNGRFIIRVNDSHLRRALLEVLQDEELGFDMIFGAFSMGLRRKITLYPYDHSSSLEEGRIVAYIEGLSRAESINRGNVYLIRGLLLKEDPWFLRRVVQRALFRLEKWGIDREDRSRRHTTIRLIDTIFGPETLRARRLEEEQ